MVAVHPLVDLAVLLDVRPVQLVLQEEQMGNEKIKALTLALGTVLLSVKEFVLEIAQTLAVTALKRMFIAAVV